MKIQVFTDEKRQVCIAIPTWLGLNYVSAAFAPIYINKNAKDSGFRVTVPMCWRFVHGFYKCKKHLKDGWNLVEVETTDGTGVKITV